MSAAAPQSFIGRSRTLDELGEVFTGGPAAGAVLVGPAGVGKTALLQRALQLAAPTIHIVRVRGSEQSAHSSYRAIDFLMSNLEPDHLGHPVLVLQGLTALFDAQAEGRPVVVAVDNAEHLDAASSMILSQLVLGGTVQVILATRDFSRVDPAFLALWSEGSLHRFDLEEFTFEEVALFAEAELGSPISGEAVRVARQRSAGNPRFLKGALRELRVQGQLVLSGGSWAVVPGRLSVCSEASVGAADLLKDCTPTQRSLMDLIALAGRLPLTRLLADGHGTAIDGLQALGLIQVDHCTPVIVRCATLFLSGALAAPIPHGKALVLYNQLVGGADGQEILGLDVEAHVAWRRRCALPVDPNTAVLAARSANHRGRYAEALDLSALHPDGGPRGAGAVEMLRALIGLGDYEGAQAALSQISRGNGNPDLESRVRQQIVKADILRHRGEAGAERPLDEAEEILKAGESLLDEQGRAHLWDELLLSRAELNSHLGRFRENETLLQRMWVGTSPRVSDMLIRLQTLLCEAWILTNKQLEALELADAVAVALSDDSLSWYTKELAWAQVQDAHRMVGDRSSTVQVLNQAALEVPGIDMSGQSCGVMARGLALVSVGRPEAALSSLIPVFNQLQIRDPQGLLPAAAAGIAYCYAIEGDIKQAIHYLPFSEASSSSPWKIQRIARYFQILASAHMESKAAAARDLHSLARNDANRGTRAFQLFALCSAVRLGDRSAIEPLASTSAGAQGAYARLCETYAKGLGNSDSELLVQAMEMAAGMGDHKFAREAAQTAVQLAQNSSDKRAIRHIQQRVRSVVPDVDALNTTGEKLEGLTKREREVAFAAAAGASNRDIAQQMCVSVRTVEGHLYQLYSKLSVSSRAELAELFPGTSTQ
ncbi:DNA-binding CsgD family transcriptional regulator [Arthrobacter sp. CAN_A214]|uniref:helix-turn-helix transcriptional regulator n=1 Tax=Arthrobacter sp. CAN_A214 TaxID=2787720 RepID=UPI0018CB8620